jgi:alpha-amylase
MNIYKVSLLIILLIAFVNCADKEEWKKRSIYQLLTDRFARDDGQQTACGSLGIF